MFFGHRGDCRHFFFLNNQKAFKKDVHENSLFLECALAGKESQKGRKPCKACPIGDFLLFYGCGPIKESQRDSLSKICFLRFLDTLLDNLSFFDFSGHFGWAVFLNAYPNSEGKIALYGFSLADSHFEKQPLLNRKAHTSIIFKSLN